MQHEAASLLPAMTQDSQGMLVAGGMVLLVFMMIAILVAYWLGYCARHTDLAELRELRKTEGKQAEKIASLNNQLLKCTEEIKELHKECLESNSKYERGRCSSELLSRLRDKINELDVEMKSRQEDINKLKSENYSLETLVDEKIHLVNVLEIEIDHLKSEIKRFNLTTFKRLKARAKLETKAEKENINRRYAKHKESLKSKAA